MAEENPNKYVTGTHVGNVNDEAVTYISETDVMQISNIPVMGLCRRTLIDEPRGA